MLCFGSSFIQDLCTVVRFLWWTKEYPCLCRSTLYRKWKNELPLKRSEMQPVTVWKKGISNLLLAYCKIDWWLSDNNSHHYLNLWNKWLVPKIEQDNAYLSSVTYSVTLTKLAVSGPKRFFHFLSLWACLFLTWYSLILNFFATWQDGRISTISAVKLLITFPFNLLGISCLP